MIKKCIKVPFVEEVTGKPGAMVRFVEQSTTPLDSTVQAAVDGLYVLGNAQLVKQTFLGLFRSMVAGVQRDGKPRKIADFIRAYPVLTGAIDLDKGFDPKTNGVYLAVELLNEMKLDTSSWSFEDVTEGRQPITIESVKGSDMGVVSSTSGAELNGRGLSGNHSVELQLEGGEIVKVDPALVSGDIARMDIAKEAFAPFMIPANDGKKLAITIRGNFAKATKTVTIDATNIELKIVKVHSTKLAADDTVSLFNDDTLIEVNQPLPADSAAFVRLVKIATGQVLGTLAHRDGCTSTMIDEKTIKVHLAGNTSEAPDGSWANMEGKRVEVIVNTPTDSCVREVSAVISEE